MNIYIVIWEFSSSDVIDRRVSTIQLGQVSLHVELHSNPSKPLMRKNYGLLVQTYVTDLVYNGALQGGDMLLIVMVTDLTYMESHHQGSKWHQWLFRELSSSGHGTRSGVHHVRRWRWTRAVKICDERIDQRILLFKKTINKLVEETN